MPASKVQEEHVVPVIAVVGPTGAGKTDFAVELAQHLGGECINADSMQFYRGMDIGTAKVTVEEMRGIPHHLLDILDIRDEASVAVFQQQARELFDQIRSRGKYPIMVGGSGLYVRAALDILDFPPTDAQVRQRLERELIEQGRGVLLRRLNEVDPVSASRVHDDRRLVRALEVWEVSGRTFSSFMPEREYFQPAVQVGVNCERSQLHQRLEARVEKMVQRGLVDEVRSLESLGLREGKTSSRAIGYREFLRLIDAERSASKSYSLEQAMIDTTTATRQFARRQITWFNADSRVTWLEGDSHAKLTQTQQLLAEY
ncbi:tRNA (adenosine(37)-N6)-dimethylallyltransferase MiaA [Rothia sp. CCM 9418]|uniref:tRNA (adenosine(37)-N6)-dimethylallyltransferase MiaA n=1 Tax=Rothia sp. CCM 9418 TaxID=3402661 RepID=UPI003AEB963D